MLESYTWTASYGYRGEALSAQTSISYSTETTTWQDSLPIYRAGDRVMITQKLGYGWNENWASRASINYSHFAKNDVPIASGVPVLAREAFNSNSDVIRIAFDTSYTRDNFSIGPAAGYLYRDHNGYDPATFQFVPAKTAWNAGVNGSYRVSPLLTLNASLQRIWVNEGGSPDKVDTLNAVIPGSGVPETSTNAWVASFGGTVKF